MSNHIFYQPIIIIGAARSGTNILRDVITQLPSFGTWPCDEINYVWRHGNTKYPTDEFTSEQVTPRIREFIHRSFAWVAQKYRVTHVVEKTCANSLRVGFVNQIFPEAKFIYLVRDGRDVVASAMERWRATLDLPYLLKKARFVPVEDLPYYASRYIWNRLYRLYSRQHRLAFWGPRFVGMQEALQTGSLAAVCALQWRRSVEKAEFELELIDQTRIYRLRYEDFVCQPKVELKRLGAFLQATVSEEQARKLTQAVTPKSVGRWKTVLDRSTIQATETLLRETLEGHGYELDTTG